jgi:hypothetical protein
MKGATFDNIQVVGASNAKFLKLDLPDTTVTGGMWSYKIYDVPVPNYYTIRVDYTYGGKAGYAYSDVYIN